jgi:hypothetical protein
LEIPIVCRRVNIQSGTLSVFDHQCRQGFPSVICLRLYKLSASIFRGEKISRSIEKGWIYFFLLRKFLLAWSRYNLIPMPIPIIIKIEKTTIMMTGTAMGSSISEVKRKKQTRTML